MNCDERFTFAMISKFSQKSFLKAYEMDRFKNTKNAWKLI